MKIIVDELPKNPIDCLFSVRSTYSGIVYYACSLKANIEGKHKNSPCICRDTGNCTCLKELFSQEDNGVGEPIYVNDKGELIGI